MFFIANWLQLMKSVWYVAFAFAVCAWLLKKLSRRHRSLFGRAFGGSILGGGQGRIKWPLLYCNFAPEGLVNFYSHFQFWQAYSSDSGLLVCCLAA